MKLLLAILLLEANVTNLNGALVSKVKLIFHIQMWTTTYAWTYYSAEANTQKGSRMHH